MKTYGDICPGDLVVYWGSGRHTNNADLTGIAVGYSEVYSRPILLIYWLNYGNIIKDNRWYLDLEIVSAYDIYRDGVKMYPPNKLYTKAT